MIEPQPDRNLAASWSKAETIALCALLVGALLTLLAFVHPWFDVRNDACIYIIVARALVAGQGPTYLGAPFTVRPPGFPALLAPLIAAFGTNFLVMNILVSVFGIAAVVLLFVHQRPRVGWTLAALTSAAIWLNPGYQTLCNQVMSDVPGLALMFAVLILERWASRSASSSREVLLGLALGLSTYVRFQILLLIPAIVASRLWSHRSYGTEDRGWMRFVSRRLAVFSLVAMILVLPWTLWSARHAPDSPADQTLNYSISTAMWHVDPGDAASPRISVGTLMARLQSNLLPIASVLGSRLQVQLPSPPPGPKAAIVDAAVALALLAALLAVLMRRRAPAEIFVVGLLILFGFYFTLTHRLLLPIYVLALAAMVEVLGSLARRFAGPRLGLLLSCGALIALIAVDFHPRAGWPRIEQRHRELVETASALTEVLPPDARLASTRGFDLSVYLDRPIYVLIHAINRTGRVDAAEGIIDRYGVNTIVLSPAGDSPEIRSYFQRTYGAGTRAGSAVVWRVRPR